MKIFFYLLPFIILLGCTNKKNDSFYKGFVEPPAEARPFFRWWWNGNHIEASEIKRELDIMKKAGIGGIEINPIAMPQDAIQIGTKPVKWLSREWNELLALACKEAKERDMIVDMIVGSGWPFGGEFLQPDEYLQRVLVNHIRIDGPAVINYKYNSLLEKMNEYHDILQAESNELLFISLVPIYASDVKQAVDLMDHYKNKTLQYSVDSGKYELIYGILQKGHRKVTLGALGASGNVMDHYSREITLKYLRRLKKISKDTGFPLSELLRALFCDSIELAGANWTDQFMEIFEDTYGYSLKPYFPFVFYSVNRGYKENEYNSELKEKLKRVRYDYNNLLVEMFLNNFTRTFQQFCTDNGLKCRYQAYGTPFLMGMLEGFMIPDIPESNNWIYSAEMDTPYWEWSKEHGYMIWNNLASAGGHLKGRKIISNEAMTNTRGVFKASLEEMKQHDDMNFISGMTHSVLCGFNYSPPEAGFPGWVRFGSYFSPQNTWWPYLHKWVDYNARLSYVFQNSEPVKSVAILGPTGDIWSNSGLTRIHFHINPWYLHEMWQTLSQNGSSCEYLNQKVICNADVENGKLVYGPMKYETLWLAGIKSLNPNTARIIKKYVENGGTLIIIDSLPDRSLSLQNGTLNDSIVESAFRYMITDYPDQIFFVKSPGERSHLMEWTSDILDLTSNTRQVTISDPNPGLYQIQYNKEDREIYFFTNTWREKTLDFIAEFPVANKIPWIWDPETGKRNVYPYIDETNKLQITLGPLESILLVFEPFTNTEQVYEIMKMDTADFIELAYNWKLVFRHVNGKFFERTCNTLKEFSLKGDSLLKSFGGEIVYENILYKDEKHYVLRLNDVNEGITEVYVNGQKAGIRWYGNHTYDLEPYLDSGENKIKIVYTTLITNYVSSLKNNKTAQRWTSGYSPVPSGIEGPIRLYAKQKIE